MDPLQRFGEYAAEFEKSYQDDDWARLEAFFAPDARYVVAGSTFDCELGGREAVLSGIKRALDGFDRRFDGREIEPNGAPAVEGNRVVFPATVRYRKEGVAPLSFTLSETAEFDDAGRIVLLRDDYDAGQDHVTRWLDEHRADFDPSYE
jgi:hypothetical protein